MIRLPQFAETISAPFSGRDGLTRAKLLRREGGTAKSEKSVDDGLDWIVRHQRADGSWSLNFHDQCQAEPCPFQPARTQSDTAATGLALLPLLGAGHIHTVKCRHQDAVRRGLEWLTAHQGARRRPLHRPAGHGLSVQSRDRHDGPLRSLRPVARSQLANPPLERAIEFICNAQDPVERRLALFARPDRRHVGLRLEYLRPAERPSRRNQVPRKVLKACSGYLDQAATDKSRVTYLYQPGRPRGAIFSTR